MSDEELGVSPAVTETAAVEAENSEIVENPEPTPEPEDKPKPDRVQRRIDKLTREKYEAQAKAEYLEKLLNQGKEEPRTERQEHGLTRDQFESDQEWIEAIADRKAELKAAAILERQKQAEREAKEAEKHKAIEQKAAKIFEDAAKLGDLTEDDFSDVTYTPAMSEAILDSDVAHKIVYFLADNPEEADRIAALSPGRQAAEIGKLEARLSESQPAQVKKSAAPAPIKPVSGGGSAYKGLSDQMSMDDWLKERNKQLRENR